MPSQVSSTETEPLRQDETASRSIQGALTDLRLDNRWRLKHATREGLVC
jgi:hypothetical protein